jgi:hypothetical protein
VTSTQVNTPAPTTKKTMTERMALRLEPKTATAPAKTSGPKSPANFSETPKNPKNSDDCGGAPAWRRGSD